MSATTLLQGRLYQPLREYVEVKEAIMESAEEALLLVDHTKFGKTATFMYGTAADYRTVFVDDAAPKEEITAMRELRTDVEVVAPGAA
jgi:DeoR/GlpR family transcriptional regulator of sugar metabolism